MSARWAKRLSWGLAGAAWFFWLGIEDRTVYFVLILSLLIAISVAITVPMPAWIRSYASRIQLLATALIGAGLGALVPLQAVLLMFIKISLHSHEAPDFSWQQVQAMLSVTPVWAAAGLLAAGAWWLLDPKPE